MSATNLSQYQEELQFKKAETFNGKTRWQRANGHHIYPSGKKWQVRKTIKGKDTYFGTFEDFHTAMRIRDELIQHNWDKNKVNYPEDYMLRLNQRKYYQYIQVHSDRRYYKVFTRKDNYLGSCHTIEEALYYRDIIKDLIKKGISVDNVRPRDYDLITDNPYLKNGLEYPVPKRLRLNKPESNYGQGSIIKKGPQSYHICHGSKGDGKKAYVCACRTYEQAYYVKLKLNECDWDLGELDRIFEEYPVWYTWLMNFYKYLTYTFDKYGNKTWLVNITAKNSDDGNMSFIRCSRLEDALYERDMLVKYDFDEEVMTECADYQDNPYYSMSLPPYPERKIRRIKEREDRTTLFNELFENIQMFPGNSQAEYCSMVDVNEVTLRNILRHEFDTNWQEFYRICESGENPNTVLVQKPLVYKPDLERHYNGTNIAYYPKRKSPYAVYKWNNDKQMDDYYGSYPTEKLAKKIVKDLRKCGWDKTQLKRIQEKHGHQSPVMSKRWVYPNKRKSKRTGEVKVYSYSIRHKDKDKRIINYGTYKDKRVAELIRDFLIMEDWDKDKLPGLQDLAFFSINMVDNNWRCRL